MVRDQQTTDTDDLAEKRFFESLTRPWALLGLVMARNAVWLRLASRHVPFLRAVPPQWETFCAVGSRYTAGSRTGKELWNRHNTVRYVFANENLPDDILRNRCRPSMPATNIDLRCRRRHRPPMRPTMPNPRSRL